MKSIVVVFFVLLIGMGIAGFFAFRAFMSSGSTPSQVSDDNQVIDETLPDNTSVELTVSKSSSKDNTVVMSVGKLDKNYNGISYEVTYETKGTFQGVNSGTKPLDLSGQSEFTKEVYLGTCSKNVCTPHTGVTEVSVAIELVDTKNKKSKLSKDFPL